MTEELLSSATFTSPPIDRETKITQSYYQKSHPRIIKFIEQQSANEKKRLEQQGARIVPLRVRNTSIAMETRGNSTPMKVNRIEFASSYDFSQVQQILISDTIQVPHGEENQLYYVNVVLLVGGVLALLCPYVYKKEDSNSLNEWMFVNAQGQTTRMRVENFEKVE